MATDLYVLTGGLATGKTEIIKGLSKHGYKAYPELEQSVLDEFFKNKNPKDNPMLYATEWFKKKLNQYDSAIKNGGGFFDRGILDPLAIFLFLGKSIPKELEINKREVRYSEKVFLIEQIPKEWFGGIWPRKLLSEEESKTFEKLLKHFYENEGYNVIAVPSMSVNNRIDFILKNII